MNEKRAAKKLERPPVLDDHGSKHSWSYDFTDDRLEMTFRAVSGEVREIDAGDGLRLRINSDGSWVGLSLYGVQRHVESLSVGRLHIAPVEPGALDPLQREIVQAGSKRAQTRAIIRLVLCGIGLQAV